MYRRGVGDKVKKMDRVLEKSFVDMVKSIWLEYVELGKSYKCFKFFFM